MTMMEIKKAYANGLFKRYGIYFDAEEITLCSKYAFAYDQKNEQLLYYTPFEGWNSKKFHFEHKGSCTSQFTDCVQANHLSFLMSVNAHKYIDSDNTLITEIKTKHFRIFIGKDDNSNYYACTVSYSFAFKDFIVENVFQL